jgi:CheY-like chemotaxis protein
MNFIREGGEVVGDFPEDDMTNYSPTILYVDEESEQRLFLAALLEYRGFRVRTARRALDALELMVTERFDAVIVDYELSDMTGAQLAQEIRAFEPAARIILFSGRAHLPAGELTYVDVHIVKGSLLNNIFEAIRGLLELPAGELINTLRLDTQRGAI